jgi:hypothetical protein
MDASKSNDLTTFLAVWGAILSSVTFGWNLLRDIRDRAKLKVFVRVRRIGVGPSGLGFAVAPDLPIEGASAELYLVIRVVNVGRRPMLWEGWGGKYTELVNGKTGFYIVGENLPKMLDERETHSEKTLMTNNWLTKVSKIYMWDASGKEWGLSWWALRKLKAEAEKALRDNASR